MGRGGFADTEACKIAMFEKYAEITTCKDLFGRDHHSFPVLTCLYAIALVLSVWSAAMPWRLAISEEDNCRTASTHAAPAAV